MSKFKKRFLKNEKTLINALVVCRGFGCLEDILEMYTTVFMLDDGTIDMKHKKLVRRQSLSDITDVNKIDMIFLDRDHIDKLVKLRPILARDHSFITAEGYDAINGDCTYPLVQFGYKCIEANSIFHIWKKVK